MANRCEGLGIPPGQPSIQPKLRQKYQKSAQPSTKQASIDSNKKDKAVSQIDALLMTNQKQQQTKTHDSQTSQPIQQRLKQSASWWIFFSLLFCFFCFFIRFCCLFSTLYYGLSVRIPPSLSINCQSNSKIQIVQKTQTINICDKCTKCCTM